MLFKGRVIAHEINNPIRTVKNTFYLPDDQILPSSPAVEYLKAQLRNTPPYQKRL